MRRMMMWMGMIIAAGILAACAEYHKKAPLAAAIYNADSVSVPPPPESAARKINVRQLESSAEGGGFAVNLRKSDLASDNEKTAPSASAQSAEESVPAPPAKANSRKVIYTGTIALAVANKVTGREAVDQIVRKFDGLVVTATLDEVTFRVTPEQFEAAVNAVAALGEVTDKQIRSEDVTAQYYDLNLRAQVAEGSRQRLMEILKKTGAVKDVLEVERDIRRLTEEIEGLKGALRKMADQIELATITVRLQEKRLVMQPRQHQMSTVFGWMNWVGLDGVLGRITENAPLNGEHSLASLLHGQRFTLGVAKEALLPAGFQPVLYDGRLLIGVTAQDNRLRAQQLELRQEKSELDFWSKALEEEFKSYRGYIVRKNEDFKLDGAGLSAKVLRSETAVGNDAWAYEVWLIQRTARPKLIYVVEFARVKKGGDEQLPAVEAAVRGIKVW